MAQPIRPLGIPNQSYGDGADTQRENPPSNNLWIGNVSQDVSEADLKALFGKFGTIDSVTTYSSRNYAFVQFRETEEARSARSGLQGFVFHGIPLKIQFAKPAKPCKSLWVAGICQSVSKEELENEFLKFGKIQEFRLLRDRNTAYVDYVALEDACQALKAMNGKRVSGANIRVDYLRSQSFKREVGPDGKEGQFPVRNTWMRHDPLSNYSDPGLAGSKRNNQFLPAGSQYGEPPRSKILWIRYPPPVVVEEDMLHNALILFGEIERIKTFSDKNYAFVEFRSVEEARRAKEGLQGKLFNDPRILIEYFNGDFPGGRAQVGEYGLQPDQMDVLGLNRPGLLGNGPGNPSSLGVRGPELYVRPPVGPSWKQLSPPPGIVSSPSAGFNVPKRSGSVDVNQFQRDSKRSRYAADALPSEITGLDEPYVRRSGASGSLTRGVPGGNRPSESDCIWRGLIAKGGTPVCHARCVAVGEGLATDIPDVVNCSARTGLDLLSKHYEDASGFDLVFFLPDSEEDFASYTEFLRYLGSKDRVGVAKFDDGTTLFLVPPSDFLTKVLKVSGPERLYGVVLKFPQVDPSSTAMKPPTVYPQFEDPHKLTMPKTGYGAYQSDERISPLNNSRVWHDDPKMLPKAPVPIAGSFPAHSVSSTAVATQAGLTLTPELIATLTSLLPSNNASSGLQTAQLLQTTLAATSHVSGGPDNVAHLKHEQQAVGQNGQLVQQLGSQVNPHLQQLQAAPIVANATSHFHQMYNPNSQMNDHTINMATRVSFSSNTMAPVIPLQSGQASVAPDANQYYQHCVSQDVLRSQGMDNGKDAQLLYNPPIVQQPAYSVASSNQLSGGAQPQPYMPLHSEVETPHQNQPPLLAAPFGVTEDSAEAEADKNERYKTTLLFAANLLSRIHQPWSDQPGQGTGSQ